MPTVTRTTHTAAWRTPQARPAVGARVRVTANRDRPWSEDNCLGEGEVVGSYQDAHLAARVLVVAFDSPLNIEMTDGPLSVANLGGPITLSRLVVHQDGVVARDSTASTEVIECPPCEVCGEPAHGDVEGADPVRSMCDECAIDQDATLTVWPEIRERQVRAEEEVAQTSPRRRRQAADRIQAIEDGVVESPHQSADYLEAAQTVVEAARRRTPFTQITNA